MRYKIEKIAKRNNLKYEVVEYWGGLKGYEFRAKDLYIRDNIYSYYFTVMYLDDYLKLKKISKMQSKLVNMFCQALHNGKTATEAKNIQLNFCALCPEYFPAYISIHAPTRGATNLAIAIAFSPCISIHAPTRGATVQRGGEWLQVVISIHAPTRGATVKNSL